MELRQTSQREELERRKIEQLRQIHRDRLARINNKKQYDAGLDYDYLKKQIEEKKARDAAEAEEEAEYQRRFLEEQRLLKHIDEEEKRIRQQIIKEDNEFRATMQGRARSREYDISHPEAFPDDPSITGLKWEGEDPNHDERVRRQNAQLQRWHKQQMMEKENRDYLQRKEDQEWERRYDENERILNEIQAQEAQTRYEIQNEINDENNRMAIEKRRHEAEEQKRELEENERERQYTNNSPFMTESRNQARGVNGRLVTQDWKGMSDEEKLQIIEERRSQMLEAQRRKQEEALRERQEEAQRIKMSREALRRERAEQRERKQREKELAEQYMKEAEEHKAMRKKQDEEYNSNVPTDDFWKFFGTSHR
ncbi:RIB43A-like with coiled-coils protein [Histomonas meleagridis]|uniref:RIB43A-like with coiled-coils protein 2 n=1 Tax=Histomonas meleagridis TaxID=135588 RepID=UPI00355A5E72|nr:RIB43A-like with coiled-coils protein [Histomonas meleagridis]KAH0805186.1 RIB43A-like with coiled-coils protein 2 [Histomonas meleagridis]